MKDNAIHLAFVILMLLSPSMVYVIDQGEKGFTEAKLDTVQAEVDWLKANLGCPIGTERVVAIYERHPSKHPSNKSGCPESPVWCHSSYWNWGEGYKDQYYCESTQKFLGEVFAGGSVQNETASVCLNSGACLPDALNEQIGKKELEDFLK